MRIKMFLNYYELVFIIIVIGILYGIAYHRGYKEGFRCCAKSVDEYMSKGK